MSRATAATTLAALALVVALPFLPASAGDKRLPCGDYDGAPSHNDCRPLPPEQKARCDAIKAKYDAIAEATNFDADVYLVDPAYIKLTKKYRRCVFAKS